MKWREDAIGYEKFDGELRANGRLTKFTIRRPEEVHHQRAAILVPGILARRAMYNPAARSLAEGGVSSVTVEHENGSMLCSEDIYYLIHEIQERLQQPVTLNGHSLGGIHSVEAVAMLAEWMKPEELPGLNLLQPAGFRGVDPRRAIESVWTERPGNQHLRHEAKVVRDGLIYVIKSMRTLPALAHKAGTDIGIVMSVGLPEGVDKQALLFPNDRLINPHQSTLGLQSAGYSVQILPVPDAGHDAPMHYPHEVADGVIGMIDGSHYPKEKIA